MNQEIPKTPDTADELVAAIDKARLQRPNKQVVESLIRLTEDMLKDHPAQHDSLLETEFKTGIYKLIDGREVEIETDLYPEDGKAKTLITAIEQLKKTDEEIRGVRKRYFIIKDEVLSSITSFSQDDHGHDFQEFNPELDKDETIGMTMEEAEAAHDHAQKGRLFGLSAGTHYTTNEEVITLMRLLSTSEEIVTQSV